MYRKKGIPLRLMLLVLAAAVLSSALLTACQPGSEPENGTDGVTSEQASDTESESESESDGSDIGQDEKKTVTFRFDSKDFLSNIVAKNNVAVTYDSTHNAMKIVAGGTDPCVVLDFSYAEINADDYEYIVVTSMMPTTNTSSVSNCELYYSSGNMIAISHDYKTYYQMSADGQFHSTIFELKIVKLWTGNVNRLRFELEDQKSSGNCQYIQSVSFCHTYSDAVAASVDKDAPPKDIQDMFLYGQFNNMDHSAPYRVYVPDGYDPQLSYPVTFLLHGAETKGSDGISHIENGDFDSLFDDPSHPLRQSIVVISQCPGGMAWVNAPTADGNYSSDDPLAAVPIRTVMRILHYVEHFYSVDPERIYVVGFGEGGFGVWDALARHSDKFAAGIAVSGGGDISKTDILKNIPIRAFHGTEDALSADISTKAMYEAIVSAGGSEISYTELEGAGGEVWEKVFSDNENFEWLLSQRKKAN